ncbi:DUF4097 family beta strand repeat-containing protein [Streptomyces sp. NPDC049954]|uniref:DUF4097 family beta strand repeat-containing protein n=1 Tax=Streptomyces sp. NPDC049954 TaxID=3155779 RepID=UPI0034320080
MARAGCALLPLLVLTACGHGGADDGKDGGFAGRPVSRTHHDAEQRDFRQAQLPSGARLVITTQGGVRVAGSGGDSVRVEDTTLAHWDGEGGTRTLDLPCDEGDERARDNCGSMPLVHVPAGASVTVRARNAGIDVSDVKGALTLSTVNGDVTVQDSGASRAGHHLVTRNGSVRATGLKARTVGAETVNGDVDLLCLNAPAALDGVTRNGSARVTLPAGAPAYATDATTVNGRSTVDLPAAGPGAHGHRLTLRTVNGDTEAHRG